MCGDGVQFHLIMAKELNSDIVKGYALKAGAKVAGVASADDFDLSREGFRPADYLEGCRSVIVMGAPSPREAFDNIADYTTSRNFMVTKMTDVAKDVEKMIKKDGHTAKAVSSTGGRTVDGKFSGHISLKHAAESAGIGIIGRNNLLLSPEYGTCLWLSAVLTTSEIVPDNKQELDYCDGCNLCVEACPAGVLDDLSSFKKKECANYFKLVGGKFKISCFKCRTVCPRRFGSGIEW